jgi:cullin-associated NEDD8-dissociated protein 1
MTEFNFHPHVKPLYAACHAKLNAQDIDQEVKEAAILCASAIIASLGNDLADELPGALKTLSERLNNEITRLTAVRAIRQIASSSLGIDLSSILREVTENLALFLRKSHRKLKQASLTALEVLVRNYGTHEAVSSQLSSVVKELAPHVKYVSI